MDSILIINLDRLRNFDARIASRFQRLWLEIM